MTEKFTFFWHGPLSQWAVSPFRFNGILFRTAEQFMMFFKAVLFEDYDVAGKIMEAVSPKEQKGLGRTVKNFNFDVWSKVARDLVYVGNYCKFTQDVKFNEILLETKGTTLVEASPYDKIWGIGLSEDSPFALMRSTWNGKNWLGETLTKVREDILYAQVNNGAFTLAKELLGRYKDE